MSKLLQILLFIFALMSTKIYSQEVFSINAVHNTTEYLPNIQHSLVIEVTNNKEAIDSLKSDIKLPTGWKLITRSDIGNLNQLEKKLVFISFYIPQDYKPGVANAFFYVKNNKYNILQQISIDFNVPEKRDIKVSLVSAPNELQPGEIYTANYAIENKGNLVEKIELFSKNSTIVGNSSLTLEPGSTVYIEVNKESNEDIFSIQNLSSELQVIPNNSDKVYKARHSVKIYPTKNKAKDQFFRFPIQASYLYNSYFSTEDDHFSVSSFEVLGHGYLDTKKEQHLDFVLRGPNHVKTNRFRSLDQYSVTYNNYKSKTKVMLGDYGLRVNNLALNGRYGFGARVDQNIDKWRLSVFYSKPRFYKVNKAIAGVQFSYKVIDSLSVGASLVSTKGRISEFNGTNDQNVQIVTLETMYNTKNTTLEFETSASLTNENVDFANYIRLRQNFGKLKYFGNLIYTGNEYMGSIYNSFALSNNLSYALTNKSNLQIGQSLSKVNERLDDLIRTTLPHYERYFIDYRIRLNKKNYIDARYTYRIREDKLEPKSYYYKEHRFRYNYRYFTKKINFNYSGHFGKSKNLLLENSQFRDTYGTGLGVSYRYMKYLSLNGNFSHTYTGKYSNSDKGTHYLGYSLGFDLNVFSHFRFNFNYNNSFNPELSYTSRDYITANMFIRLSRNHQFEVRTNYYSSPGVIKEKDFYGFCKYTYLFGAPLKRTSKLGGVNGSVLTLSENINLNGIAINSVGSVVKTNELGSFEINNLPLGKNYIYVDIATLPSQTVVAKKMPILVEVTQDKLAFLEIPLVKASNLTGKLDLEKASKNYDLTSFLKLESDDFTYYTQSESNGSFSFKKVVPGNYKLSVLKIKNEPKAFNSIPVKNIVLKAGEKVTTKVFVVEKERRVKFKNTNFIVKM